MLYFTSTLILSIWLINDTKNRCRNNVCKLEAISIIQLYPKIRHLLKEKFSRLTICPNIDITIYFACKANAILFIHIFLIIGDITAN